MSYCTEYEFLNASCSTATYFKNILFHCNRLSRHQNIYCTVCQHPKLFFLLWVDDFKGSAVTEDSCGKGRTLWPEHDKIEPAHKENTSNTVSIYNQPLQRETMSIDTLTKFPTNLGLTSVTPKSSGRDV